MTSAADPLWDAAKKKLYESWPAKVPPCSAERAGDGGITIDGASS